MSGYEDMEKRPRFDSGALHQDAEDAHGVAAGQLSFQDQTTPPAVTTKIRDVDDRFTPRTPVERLQKKLLRVLEHFAFRVFTILMILVDVVVVIIDLCEAGDKKTLEVLSIIICSYFMLEVLVRIFAKGPKAFFTNWIDVVDSIIVLISFVFTIIYSALDLNNTAGLGNFNPLLACYELTSGGCDSPVYAADNFGCLLKEQQLIITLSLGLIIAGRMIRIVLLLRIITEKRHLEKSSRLMVSQNKRRYQKDGFDLDLCYITERVIAMSFPSKGLMALYRNPIREVARFLDTKHKDHYKVFNLCSERMYDESLFHYQVERIRIDDHNVPKLHEMLEFAKTATEWMDADPQNIIAIHCKGGKGRTGTVICTWLIESGEFNKAQDSLEYFGDRRTDLSVGSSFQGVETPSQSRYVGYFEKMKHELGKQLPPPKRLKLTGVTIYGLPAVETSNGNDLNMRIVLPDKVWEYNLGDQSDCKTKYQSGTRTLSIDVTDGPVLMNDVKMMFYAPKLPKGYDKCSFFFWFYTSFIEANSLKLKREELDNPHKSSRWNVYQQDFSVELHFSDV